MVGGGRAGRRAGREAAGEARRTARKGGEREVGAPGRSLQVSLVRSLGVRGCPELRGVWPAPALRSAFAKAPTAGATAPATKAAQGGEDVTATARLATARASVAVPTEAVPGRHDSAEGRRARARARGAAGRARGRGRTGGGARAASGGRGPPGRSARRGGRRFLFLARPRWEGALAGVPGGVAKVSSWTWGRTPEGPRRARPAAPLAARRGLGDVSPGRPAAATAREGTAAATGGRQDSFFGSCQPRPRPF